MQPAPPPTHAVTRGARRALAVLLLINVINYADRYVVPAVLPKIQREFGLTAFQEGLLGSSFILVYALTALPLGIWADRGLRTRIIGGCIALWSLATLLVGAAQNFWQLLGLRTVLGIGESGYSPASQSLIADYFPKQHRARFLAYFSAGNLVGAAVGVAAGGLIADAFGWRWAFYLVSLPGFMLAAAAWRIYEPVRGSSEVRTRDAPLSRPTFRRIIQMHMHTATFWTILIALTLSFFALGGASFWLPTYLVRSFGISVGMAGVLSGIVLVCSGFVGTLGGGWLADRAQRRADNGRLRVVCGAFIIGAPLVFGAFLIHTLPLFIAALALAATSLSLCNGPLIAATQDIVVPHVRSTVLGLMSLVANLLGGAAAPTAIGLIGGAHSLHFALITTIPTCLFLAGCTCFIGLKHVARDMAAMQAQL